METQPPVDRMNETPRAAPVGFWPVVQQLGPGLIIAASIVGSGELIVTTKLGASVGYTLLWFIILGCLVKVFVQIELGRYAIAHGQSTLQALNRVPGPRLWLGWMVYVWLVMYIATFFQVAGMVGAVADIFDVAGAPWSKTLSVVGITVSCSVLLAYGKYRVVERVSTSMVALFTMFTIVAVAALSRTQYAVHWASLRSGLTFQLPDDFTIAFAAFGIIGVGASELIYYPYWCLEKGYARAVGPNDGSDAWGERARGWMRVLSIDAWASMVVYTGATIAFYILGAAVLNGKNIEVSDAELILSLSHMYSESFGSVGFWVFLCGAFIVLYSTIFIATASNGRLFADFASLLGFAPARNNPQYDGLVRKVSAALPVVYAALFLFVAKPVKLVFIGALAQAFMLPLLCVATLYFYHVRMERQLTPRLRWTICLWISSLLMIAIGIYQMVQKFLELL